MSKHHIQPAEYGDEQGDAGRDYRTRLARPKLSEANEDREYSFSPVKLTTSRIGNLTRLILTLAICVTIHTYIMVTIHYSTQHGIELVTNSSLGPNHSRTTAEILSALLL